jgi:hypothetical protein
VFFEQGAVEALHGAVALRPPHLRRPVLSPRPAG